MNDLFILDEALDYLNEGANINITKAYKETKKNLDKEMKEFKKCLKYEEFDNGRASIKKMHDIINDGIDDIKAIESNKAEKAIGNAIYSADALFAYTLHITGGIVTVITGNPVLCGAAGAVAIAAIKEKYAKLKEFRREFEREGKKLTNDDYSYGKYNFYQYNMVACLRKLKDILKDCDEILKDAEREFNKDKRRRDIEVTIKK